MSLRTGLWRHRCSGLRQVEVAAVRAWFPRLGVFARHVDFSRRKRATNAEFQASEVRTVLAEDGLRTPNTRHI